MRILVVLAALGPLAAVPARAECLRASSAHALAQGLRARPEGLLEHYPAGGRAMVFVARQAIAADPGAQDSILALARQGSDAQRRALGTALGEAIARCRRAGDSERARRLGEAVALLDDRAVREGIRAAARAASDAAGDDLAAGPPRPAGHSWLAPAGLADPGVPLSRRPALPDPFRRP